MCSLRPGQTWEVCSELSRRPTSACIESHSSGQTVAGWNRNKPRMPKGWAWLAVRTKDRKDPILSLLLINGHVPRDCLLSLLSGKSFTLFHLVNPELNFPTDGTKQEHSFQVNTPPPAANQSTVLA